MPRRVRRVGSGESGKRSCLLLPIAATVAVLGFAGFAVAGPRDGVPPKGSVAKPPQRLADDAPT